MRTTPVYGFPYPEPVDAADGPFALERLALAVEGQVARIFADTRVGSDQAGTTPLYGWPWPGYTDAADGSGAVEALALAMDATVGQLFYGMLAGLAVYDGDTLGELAQVRSTLLQLSQLGTVT